MDVVRGLYNIKKRHTPCVVTIGNFDGVHRGHQAVIEKLANLKKQYHMATGLICFKPHPQTFFNPDKAPARLSTWRDKISRLAQLDLDFTLLLQFNAQLASMSAIDFVKHILVDSLAVKHILIGDDFRFGAKRAGDFDLLQQIGNQYGFLVERIQPVMDGQRISSTSIRQALAIGDCELANRLLGNPFTITSRVRKGAGIGHDLGFPTINLRVCLPCPLKLGIYAVEVSLESGQKILGAANIGTRPTVTQSDAVVLEVHLFETNQDLYHQRVSVSFFHYLHEERLYPSLESLQRHIAQDVADIKAYFTNAR